MASHEVAQIFTLGSRGSAPVIYTRDTKPFVHTNTWARVVRALSPSGGRLGFIFLNHYEPMNLNTFSASHTAAVNIPITFREAHIFHTWPVETSSCWLLNLPFFNVFFFFLNCGKIHKTQELPPSPFSRARSGGIRCAHSAVRPSPPSSPGLFRHLVQTETVPTKPSPPPPHPSPAPGAHHSPFRPRDSDPSKGLMEVGSHSKCPWSPTPFTRHALLGAHPWCGTCRNLPPSSGW